MLLWQMGNICLLLLNGCLHAASGGNDVCWASAKAIVLCTALFAVCSHAKLPELLCQQASTRCLDNSRKAFLCWVHFLLSMPSRFEFSRRIMYGVQGGCHTPVAGGE